MTVMFTPFGGCLVVNDNFLSTKKRKSKWHDTCFICNRDWCKVHAGCVSIGLLLLLLGFPLRRPF